MDSRTYWDLGIYAFTHTLSFGDFGYNRWIYKVLSKAYFLWSERAILVVFCCSLTSTCNVTAAGYIDSPPCISKETTECEATHFHDVKLHQPKSYGGANKLESFHSHCHLCLSFCCSPPRLTATPMIVLAHTLKFHIPAIDLLELPLRLLELPAFRDLSHVDGGEIGRVIAILVH